MEKRNILAPCAAPFCFAGFDVGDKRFDCLRFVVASINAADIPANYFVNVHDRFPYARGWGGIQEGMRGANPSSAFPLGGYSAETRYPTECRKR